MRRDAAGGLTAVREHDHRSRRTLTAHRAFHERRDVHRLLARARSLRDAHRSLGHEIDAIGRIALAEEHLAIGELAGRRGIEEAVCADAARLPFPDACFDCVFVGYGLRNFPSLPSALSEVKRVTRPGGLLVALDFFLPANTVLRRLYLAYLYAQGTFWGLLLHGRPRIYTYIPDSLRHFVSIPEFERLLESSGYRRTSGCAYIFGGIGLLWAEKRAAPQC